MSPSPWQRACLASRLLAAPRTSAALYAAGGLVAFIVARRRA